MELPIVFEHTRFGMEYTASSRAELLMSMRFVMDDHRTEKYERINFLLDAYNNWDHHLEEWLTKPERQDSEQRA